MLNKLIFLLFFAALNFDAACLADLAPHAKATLHAILVADTNDVSIGKIVEADQDKLIPEIVSIAKQLGMKLDLQILKENRVTRENLIDSINAVSAGKNDVVFFFFNGHGYHEETKDTPWPDLYFSEEGIGISFDLVNEMLLKKKTRLLISFAHSCNNIVPDHIIPTMKQEKAFVASPALGKSSLKKLFLQSKGTIFMCSAVVGQYTWSHKVDGGFFIRAFLDSFHDEIQQGANANWHTLMENTLQQTWTSTLKLGLDQTPLYKINLN